MSIECFSVLCLIGLSTFFATLFYFAHSFGCEQEKLAFQWAANWRNTDDKLEKALADLDRSQGVIGELRMKSAKIQMDMDDKLSGAEEGLREQIATSKIWQTKAEFWEAKAISAITERDERHGKTEALAAEIEALKGDVETHNICREKAEAKLKRLSNKVRGELDSLADSLKSSQEFLDGFLEPLDS